MGDDGITRAEEANRRYGGEHRTDADAHIDAKTFPFDREREPVGPRGASGPEPVRSVTLQDGEVIRIGLDNEEFFAQASFTPRTLELRRV